MEVFKAESACCSLTKGKMTRNSFRHNKRLVESYASNKVGTLRTDIFFMVSVIFLTGWLLFFVSSPKDASAAIDKADKVVVIKSKRVMMLIREGEILKVYRIALGKDPVGPKIFAGDQRTPEGFYVLDSRNRGSNYHLALHISYPNLSDVQNAKKYEVSPGGDIMIHGLSRGLGKLGKFHRYKDWTNGCIAVTNDEIEEIWSLVPDGTPIEIKP
ncbi:MAG: L,D-transpeptidase family protein [Dissulfurispiraceae bacterium]